jgi:hypothetical protein
MRKIFKIYLFLIILLIISCKESYNPIVTSNNSNLLVVEGFINSGADSTIVKLSRTVTIANKTTLNPESGATLVVESNANETFALKEGITKGTYYALPLNLNSTKKYRLKITSSKGAIYLSDFVEVKESPPIDNIGYEVKSDGLQININTHDVNNKSVYYRWEYQESWIFYAKLNSLLVWNGTAVVDRNLTSDNIYQCWGNENSTKILLASSSKLAQDVIYQAPINFLPSSSEKLSEKYSILIKQYVLTKEAYEFWQNLKKNTESLGSIFDAQPSQLTGNIKNINDQSEPVIGYISVGTFQQKRIFVSKDSFPLFKVKYPFDCGIPELAIIKDPGDDKKYFGNFLNIPIEYGPGTNIVSSNRECADCTLRGTNKRPSFWQ